MAHPIKEFIYHHEITARIYFYIRGFRRDCHNWMSEEKFAKWYYKKNTGMELELDNPKSFDEKIWFLKLYDKNPLKKICSDKLTVRDYVKECGLESILNEVYGAYDSFEQVEFEKLPKRFFMKCTHTSGCNAIYDKDKPFDYKYYKHEFNYWLRRDYYWESREWNYKGLSSKIICEKILEDKEGKLPADYKFFCFQGKVEILTLDIGVASQNGEHSATYWRNIYNRSFELIDVKETRESYPGEISKPKNYDDMVRYAEILSKPFRHCRVDLYNIEGRIYFGEITFHHGGGCNNFEPKEFAYRLGDCIDIRGIEGK